MFKSKKRRTRLHKHKTRRVKRRGKKSRRVNKKYGKRRTLRGGNLPLILGQIQNRMSLGKSIFPNILGKLKNNFNLIAGKDYFSKNKMHPNSLDILAK